MNPSRRQRLVHVSRQVFFWLTLAIVLFLLTMYWLVSDRTAFGEWITIWPSFFWAFGLIPLAMLSHDRKHWRKSLLLFGTIIVFLLATVECRSLIRWPDSKIDKELYGLRLNPPAPGRRLALRVVSWNINGGSGGRQAILEKLAALQPDVCFLQETPDGSDSFQPGDLTGYWSGFAWRDEGDCGLLSRYPIRHLESRRIGPWARPQIALIEPTTGTSVLLFNVRLMLPSLVINPLPADSRRSLISDHAARLEQYRNFAALIKETMQTCGVNRAMVAGDFNTPANMASLAPLRAFLMDSWLTRGRGWGATMTNEFPVARIDQCWATPNLRVADARVIDGAPSDHRLLIIDFLIDP